MKKKILTVVIALLAALSVKAQSDGFFSTSYKEFRETDEQWGVMPLLPGTHGIEYDFDATQVPLGGGLLLLGGMALLYARTNDKRKNG